MRDGKKYWRLDHGWWIVGVLWLMVVSFIFDIWGDTKTIRENPPVEHEFYSTDTVRQPLVKPGTSLAGSDFDCTNCHDYIDPPQVPPKLVADHEDIVMDHEEAMTCYTCHSRENRSVLVDIYGTEVAFEHSENLCRRCHGPHYRDWKLGIHGRVSGYWDKTKGDAANLMCVYCHNTHAPKFKPMRPSPPPIRDNYITGNRGVPRE